MSEEVGTILTCGCKILAADGGISRCPLRLAALRSFGALTNLEREGIGGGQF